MLLEYLTDVSRCFVNARIYRVSLKLLDVSWYHDFTEM